MSTEADLGRLRWRRRIDDLLAFVEARWLAVWLLGATVLDGVAVGVVSLAPQRLSAWAVAALIHGAVAFSIWGQRRIVGSRRELAAVLTVTLPVLGPALAAVVLGTPGGDLQAAMEPESPEPTSVSLNQVHLITDGLPLSEALLTSASPDERREVLAVLVRRAGTTAGDPRAVALLRWALTASDPELAVEAALALEELSMTFEARLQACREELLENACFATALATGDAIAAAIQSGLADMTLVPSLAAEARRAYEQAAALDPSQSEVVSIHWARMELHAMRPDEALRIVERALAGREGTASEELWSLREEAALAVRHPDVTWDVPTIPLQFQELPFDGVTTPHVPLPGEPAGGSG